MHDFKMVLRVIFYKELSGKEPVKDWLCSLKKEERKTIGEDIKRVQFGWPIGMPLARSLGSGLWEVRSTLGTRQARIIFMTYAGGMILLHGFIKKTQKTPASDLELAKKRAKNIDPEEL